MTYDSGTPDGGHGTPSRDPNDLGALWKGTRERGPSFTGTIDITPALVAAVSGTEQKIRICVWECRPGSNPRAPSHRIKIDTWKPDGQKRDEKPAATERPSTGVIGPGEDDIPF